MNKPDQTGNLDKLPLLNHPLDEPTAFTPQSLMDTVRHAHCIPAGSAIPPICILEFDGDITD